MCFRYTCRSCRLGKIIYCKSADWTKVDPKCYLPTIDPQPHIKRKRCPTCEVVEGAIRELRNLVFRQPWLETEGASAKEKLPDWQLEETEKQQGVNILDWHRAEDVRLLNRLKAMGLDELDGREALNDGHGVVTGVNSVKKSQDNKKEQMMGDEGNSRWDSDEGTLASATTSQDALWLEHRESTKNVEL